MNKRKALKECIKMWDWLADNTDKFKCDYFSEFGLTKVRLQCFACEASRDCDNCIIDGGEYETCLSDDSPYMRWTTAWMLSEQVDLDRKQAAIEIANLTRLSLEKLKWYEGRLWML